MEFPGSTRLPKRLCSITISNFPRFVNEFLHPIVQLVAFSAWAFFYVEPLEFGPVIHQSVPYWADPHFVHAVPVEGDRFKQTKAPAEVRGVVGMAEAETPGEHSTGESLHNLHNSVGGNAPIVRSEPSV